MGDSKHILILCANVKGNVGDLAILDAMIRGLSQRYPGRQVKFFYHGDKYPDTKRFPAFLESLPETAEDLGPAPYYRRSLPARWAAKLGKEGAFAQKMHNRSIEQTVERMQGARDFCNALSGSEAVYFAGGAQWGRGNLNLNMLAQLHLAQRLCGKVYAFPFSVSDGVLACNGPVAFKEHFDSLTRPVIVRDLISLQRLQFAQVDVTQVCDCVFSLADVVAQLDLSREPDQSRVVYLSITPSGAGSDDQYIQTIELLRGASYEPVLFSSCVREDQPLLDRICARVDVPVRAPVTWREAVEKLSSARFVITNRLHCLIFSALSGTAVVPLANRSKAEAYVRDAQLPVSLPSLAALDSELLTSIEAELANARERQVEYAQDCSAKLGAAFDQLCGR